MLAVPSGGRWESTTFLDGIILLFKVMKFGAQHLSIAGHDQHQEDGEEKGQGRHGWC